MSGGEDIGAGPTLQHSAGAGSPLAPIPQRRDHAAMGDGGICRG